ncbi:MAG: hypothetical protein Q4B70_13250, partial [Lachnospiraceae bacterium]|nr:hypothetical protein [Lachnospiraceae bacterium]
KILIPKWNDISGMPGTRTEDFYKQEKNSMDAMFFGSSFIYYSISPLPIWDNYGITSYSFGNPGQRIWTSYYYMEEAFKYQSPKVVFYEVGTSYVEEQAKEEWNRQNIDYLPFSLTKWNAIKAIRKGTKETTASYLLPGLRYHDRWSELTENDFDRNLDTGYYGKGSLMRFGAKPAKSADIKNWMTDTGENLTFPKENESYLDKMKALCEKNGAELVLLRLPNVYWTQNLHNMIQEVADEKELTFIDYNMIPDEYGLDWKTDTTDKGDHMNVVGNEKVSNYLGQYMKDHYHFEDKRDNEAYASWAETSENFSKIYEKNRIANIVDMSEYLNFIQQDCYTAVIAVKGDTTRELKDETKEILRKMGVDEAMMTTREGSYIGILDSGTIIEQQSGQELLEYKDMVGEIKIEAKSGGRLVGNQALIQIDGEEYSPDNTGINIVVYDKDLKRVVDSVSFNTTRANNKISRRLQNTANDEF